jgi:NhaA family Na+:H+ antiporter
MQVASQGVQTPLARVEHALLKPVAYVIVPLFALANAGVDLTPGETSALTGPVMWGVLLGLLIGKPLGVLLASWAVLKTGWAAMPEGATRRQLAGVALLCGIGFTMSLFVANLAFPGQQEQLAATKIGIIIASVVSSLAGSAVLVTAGRRSRQG